MNTTTNTVNTNTERNQPVTAGKTNWMINAAGVLFWAVAFFQFMFVWHDKVDQEFINFVFHNALPLIGVLAFFGIRKEQKAIADCNDDCDQTPNSDC